MPEPPPGEEQPNQPPTVQQTPTPEVVTTSFTEASLGLSLAATAHNHVVVVSIRQGGAAASHAYGDGRVQCNGAS